MHTYAAPLVPGSSLLMPGLESQVTNVSLLLSSQLLRRPTIETGTPVVLLHPPCVREWLWGVGFSKFQVLGFSSGSRIALAAWGRNKLTRVCGR